jgi:hypothetical protein
MKLEISLPVDTNLFTVTLFLVKHTWVFTYHCVTGDRPISVVAIMMMLVIMNFTSFEILGFCLIFGRSKVRIYARKSPVENKVRSRFLQPLPVKVVIVPQVSLSSLPLHCVSNISFYIHIFVIIIWPIESAVKFVQKQISKTSLLTICLLRYKDQICMREEILK